MELKFKYDKNRYIFEKIAIVLLLLLVFKFFYLINNNSILVRYNIDNRLYTPIIISLIIIVIYNLFKNKSNNRYVFGNNLMVFFCIIVFNYLITYIRYSDKESMKNIISPNSYYFAMISYFAFVKIINNKKLFEFFIKILTFFSIFSSLVYIIQNYIFMKTGTFFLYIPDMIKSGELFVSFRGFGNMRMTYGACLVSISLMISLGIIFSDNKVKKKTSIKIFHFINIIVSYFYLIFISQTRALLLVVIIILIYNLIINKSIDKKKKVFYLLAITTILVIAMVYFKDYFTVLFKYSKTENAYSYRMNSYKYYFNSILSNIFGIGMISDSFEYGYQLVHGPFRTCYYSDVGIIGTAAKLGVYTAIWYIYIILKMGKIALGLKRKGNLIGINLIMLIIGMLPSLSALDSGNIYIIPLSMLVIEKTNIYIYMNLFQKKRQFREKIK